MYKLVFFVPESHLDVVKEAVFATGAGRMGHYSHCCWQILGEGQFMPMPGAHPLQQFLLAYASASGTSPSASATSASLLHVSSQHEAAAAASCARSATAKATFMAVLVGVAEVSGGIDER